MNFHIKNKDDGENKFDKIEDGEISHKTIGMLRKKYILAVSILFIMLLLSQIIIQYAIGNEQDDSRVINIAGRQRMLSQRINKTVFALYINTDTQQRGGNLLELNASLDLWQQSHEGLKYGDKELGLPGKNSEVVISMFQEIEGEYLAIVEAAENIERIAANPDYDRESLIEDIQIIKDNEAHFLKGMDQIVFQYDKESKEQIGRIRITEIIILLISILILALEMHFIFLPAIYNVKRSLAVIEKGKARLREEKELFQAILLSVEEAIIGTDRNGKIVFMNSIAEHYTGWEKEEALGRAFDEVFQRVTPLEKNTGNNLISEVIKTGKTIINERSMTLLSRSGHKIKITARASGIFDANDYVDGVVVSFRDVTKEHEQENQIEGFLMVNLEMLGVCDQEGKFLKVNQKFEDILGYKTEEIEGKYYQDFIHEDDVKPMKEVLNDLTQRPGTLVFTNRFRCKDSTYKYIEWHSKLSEGKFIYTSARDVTENHTTVEKLKKIAARDELTGLYNRYFFDTIVEDEMERADRYGEPLSMAILDMDHFKNVNDTWGHPVGDELLVHIAKILQSSIRNTDSVIRFGGEEFVVLMPHTMAREAKKCAEKIRRAIEETPYLITGKQTVSIGVAERMHYESLRRWYARADEILYLAKENGRNRVEISDGLKHLPLESAHLEWKNEWESGNSEIDSQHQKLIELSNQLIQMSISGANQEETLYHLERLLKHIINHFHAEEVLLRKLSYPEYDKHASIHDNLVSKATRLKEMYEHDELKSSAFFSFIVDDVIHGHLLEWDIRFFPYTNGSKN